MLGPAGAEAATIVNLSASGLMLHVPVRPSEEYGSNVVVQFLGTRKDGVVRHVSRAQYGFFVGVEYDHTIQTQKALPTVPACL